MVQQGDVSPRTKHAMSAKSLGKHIRQRRNALRIGLRELARTVKISPTYLHQVEMGTVSAPSDAKITAIADALSENANVLYELSRRVPTFVLATYQERPSFFRQLFEMTRGLSEVEQDALLGLIQNAVKQLKHCSEVVKKTR